MEHENEKPQRTYVADMSRSRIVDGTVYGPGTIAVTEAVAKELAALGVTVRKATQQDLEQQQTAPAQNGPAGAETTHDAQTASAEAQDATAASQDGKNDAQSDGQAADSGQDPHSQGGWDDVRGAEVTSEGSVTGQDPTEPLGAVASEPEPKSTKQPAKRTGQLPAKFPGRAVLIAAGLTTLAKVSAAAKAGQLPVMTQAERDQLAAELVEA